MDKIDKIIIITTPDDNDFPTQWGVYHVPAYLDRQGHPVKSAQGNWAVALGAWESSPGWEGQWLRHAGDAAIVIHPGGGRTLESARIQGRTGIRNAFGSKVFTWSSGGAGAQRALADILADVAGWRKTGNAEHFKQGVELLAKALAEAAGDPQLATEEARSKKAAEVFNKGCEAAGLPERGPPPDPLSVLIHDTIGAIDPFVLDVRNLLDGNCELEEFQAYWKGKAATGVRRLRAWLGEGETASSEKEWLERSRLGQYQESDERKKENIRQLLTEIPTVLNEADEGRLTPQSNEQLRSLFEELYSWLRDLKAKLEALHHETQG